MKRFQWKVVSLMMLVSVLPLIFSAVVVDKLLRDTVAIGFDESISQGLEGSADVYRRYIDLRKDIMPLQTIALAQEEDLKSALPSFRSNPGEIRQVLLQHTQKLENVDQGVVRVSLHPARGAEPQNTIFIDHSERYPSQNWRTRTTDTLLQDPEGEVYKLSVTYAVPWRLFSEFQSVGEVRRTLSHLAKRKGDLGAGYFRTFMAFSLAILFLTFLIGFFLARATTQRLAGLANATRRVAAGDLDHQIPLEGKDEIAELTRDFNAMIVDLKDTNARLAYLERVSTWQEIARRLAHEIKNPLTPILLAVQQLDNKFDDLHTNPKRYRRLVSTAMEIVGEEVDALRKLVREFSEFARLPRVTPQRCDARLFVQDVLRTNPQFETHLAPYSVHGSPLMTSIDNVLMRRVMVNLLQNAVDAMRGMKKDPSGSLRVETRQLSHTQLAIYVEDDGEGVPEANQARLFDPYFTTKEDGTGLGLAIVRKIVIDHGGDIRVISPLEDREKGTRFEILLPIEEEA